MPPFNRRSKEKARELRRNMTLAEKRLWYQLLANDGLNGLRFLRQKPIDRYIVDFYCHKLKLVIEIDGESHLVEGAKEYDEVRTKVLNGYDIEVIRYTNDEVLNHFNEVEADLRKRIP
jgi:very-short-patch-repair endonuclease